MTKDKLKYLLPVPNDINYVCISADGSIVPVKCEWCGETRNYFEGEMIYEWNVLCEWLQKGKKCKIDNCKEDVCVKTVRFCSYNCRSKYLKANKEKEKAELRRKFEL